MKSGSHSVTCQGDLYEEGEPTNLLYPSQLGAELSQVWLHGRSNIFVEGGFEFVYVAMRFGVRIFENKTMTRYFTFIYIVQQRRKLDDFHRPDIVATCGFKVEYEEVIERTGYSFRRHSASESGRRTKYPSRHSC